MSQALLFHASDPAIVRVEALLRAQAHAVIDLAVERGATELYPLFSGGHDSLCACFLASSHRLFDGRVHHIDTGIGAKATRAFVEEVCAEYGWTLVVYRSNFSYEKFVRRLGFPGPGAHGWIYNKLKDRCVSQMTKGRGRHVALVTGCREQESERRMGHVEAVKVGETSKKTGIVRRKGRIWTAPCFDWSAAEQHFFMAHHDLPRNPIKDTPLAMSGECFCGAFARPAEIELLRRYAPDVAEEIDRLTAIARDAGTPSAWGCRNRDLKKGVIVAETGPLCSSCDVRARAAGLLFEDLYV